MRSRATGLLQQQPKPSAAGADYEAMSSPVKQVPLAPASDDDPRPSHPTTRAFFCGVVVEGAGEGELAQDVQELVASLGEPMPAQEMPYLPRSAINPSGSGSALSEAPSSTSMKRSASADAAVLSEVITELVTTERSYLKRLCMLKSSYADPLRSFAKTKDTSIIDAYAAKTLFGNVDQLIPVSEAFLADLEVMLSGHGPGVGDVAIKHFRDFRAFDCYKQYYTKREEAQQIFEREVSKKSGTGFASYIDRIKYSTSDPKNRVGLRELLMEPVQRIPRYTLLFRTMIKHMPTSNPQRALLMEADAVASQIALAETDDPTRRAAVMHCLERSVEHFPPGLISSTRVLVDCIDVADVLGDSFGRGGGSTRGGHGTHSRGAKQGGGGALDTLQATLFLFDDKLMICKRNPSSSAPGRILAGLDETEKVAKVGLGLGLGFRKALGGSSASKPGGGWGLSCRGVIDAGDVVATDVGGVDFHMYLEDPPRDQPDRWTGRPFRAMTALALAPQSLSGPADPFARPRVDSSPEQAKARFLENLWAVQARLRTRLGRSVVLYGGEREVGLATLARTWWNLYSRTAYLSETKKPKVMVHIDAEGAADPLPFGMGGAAPYVVIRVQPLAGELCRFAVSSCNEEDEREEDIVHTPSVPGRIVQTIHQYGLFKFRTGHASAPGTPTRPRTALFSLDTLSFGSMSMSNRRARSRSVASRNSTLFSSASGSTSATSEEGASMGRKFMKRSWSPGPGLGMSVPEGESVGPAGSSVGYSINGRSSPLKGRVLPDEDYDACTWDDLGEEADEMDVDVGEDVGMDPDTSEYDLTMRLALARQNSKSQDGKVKANNKDAPELPPLPAFSRPASPTKSRDIDSDVATVSTARPPGIERRPLGPRSLIPRSPDIRATAGELDRAVSPVGLDRAKTPVEMERAMSPSILARTGGAIARAKSPIETEQARIDRAIIAGPRPISPGPGRALGGISATGSVIGLIRAPVARKPVPVLARATSPRAFSPPVTRAFSPPAGHAGPESRAPSPVPVVRTSSLISERSDSSAPIERRAPTPLAWGSDRRDESDEDKRPYTPVDGANLDTPAPSTTLRTDVAGSTPIPFNSSKRRIPFESAANTPTPATNVLATPKSTAAGSTIAPLSIQKKISLREAPVITRKGRGSPTNKVPERHGSLVRMNSNPDSIMSEVNVASTSTGASGDFTQLSKQLFITAGATKEDLLSSRRAVKRIKVELESISRSTGSQSRPGLERTGSLVRSPNSRNIAAKADNRFDNLPSIINRRAMFEAIADNTPSSKLSASTSDSALSEMWSKSIESIEGVITEVERHLIHAEAKHDRLIEQIQELQNAPPTTPTSSTDVERLKGEVQRAKGQCELVKKLLADATAEKEIMYETFNEELDAMYADSSLRDDEALVAMADDLRKSKAARNDLAKENLQLKRKLAEMEFEKQHYEDMLRRHGLIS
ncbi:Rho guanine nucleotide exchange factor gef2 OS=Schizosaccharomyces pombe (strain 972 / ATCC 24843) GN=gef2 PE=1 SV=1 [Rhizoctonia solani AG-1 IB]|uniref:Rho guanine nucleotide exchange factor gef2 n=1 Tax=Thanatephorus cucumeris (strain AG1-IB / isolate 7/3/14) TaxID=1108050 RepID=A0A0B7FQ70_THACB|nr:Rho guanine nucleotide exchange factor gef2 OS=Schizosaccharomyces pombe (strain 972 / ATCC 24843) GN=gef2 PE=1 SV=1 [Rhizoctonia solani AG-1 IB]